jgi:adenine-specific DNA-methyltransferase
VELTFYLSSSGKRIAALESLPGRSGWLTCVCLTLQSLETEDHILLCGVLDDGTPVEFPACKRLFDLDGLPGLPVLLEPPSALHEEVSKAQCGRLAELAVRSGKWLDSETEKLDRWTEDLKFGLEQEIKDLDKEIRDMGRQSAAAVGLQQKLDHQKRLKELTSTRNQRRKELFIAQDEVEVQRDKLISEIQGRLKQEQKATTLFTIRWSLV